MDITGIVPKGLLRQRVDGLAFTQQATTSIKLPKGMLTDHLVLSGFYQVVITGSATSARATGCPIVKISVVADNGLVLKAWRPRDLINRATYYGQAPLSSIVQPPPAASGTTSGRFDIPIPFGELFTTDFLRFKTSLPTWLYNELYLVIDWGGMNEVYVPAAATGVFTLVPSGGGTGLSLSAFQWDKYSVGASPLAFAQSQGVVYESYIETPVAAVANLAQIIDLPRTEDIRSILIQCEDSNNEPTNNMLNAITLEENNVTRRINNLDATAVRQANGKEFGLGGITPAVGLYVLEFCPDKDISNGLIAATSMTALRLSLNTQALAGTIRVATVRPGVNKVS